VKKFILSLNLPEEIPQVGRAGVDLFTQIYARVKTLQESGILGEGNE
jgi:hypothetical protein